MVIHPNSSRMQYLLFMKIQKTSLNITSSTTRFRVYRRLGKVTNKSRFLYLDQSWPIRYRSAKLVWVHQRSHQRHQFCCTRTKPVWNRLQVRSNYYHKSPTSRVSISVLHGGRHSDIPRLSSSWDLPRRRERRWYEEFKLSWASARPWRSTRASTTRPRLVPLCARCEGGVETAVLQFWWSYRANPPWSVEHYDVSWEAKPIVAQSARFSLVCQADNRSE